MNFCYIRCNYTFFLRVGTDWSKDNQNQEVTKIGLNREQLKRKNL
jgi:hypothetical protein